MEGSNLSQPRAKSRNAAEYLYQGATIIAALLLVLSAAAG